MAKVPYQSFPTATPESPGEKIAVSTPGAAFGENIGQAIEHLGTTTTQVGDELFNRAIALQQLNNENTAREAVADYMSKQGELHANYSALTGKAARDGLEPYIQSSKDLMNDTADGIGAPMARKMFLDNATSFLGRNIFNAAGHAATENKQYTINSLDANTNLLIKSSGDDPTDEKANAQRKAQIIEATTQAAELKAGTDDPNNPIIKDATAKAVSAWRRERILGLAKTNPTAAQDMLDKYGDDLYGSDKIAVQNQVEGRSNAVAASNITDTYLTAHTAEDGSITVSATQAQRELKAIAEKQFPDSPLLPQEVIRNFDAKVNQQRWATRNDRVEAVNTVTDAILKNNITDSQELLAIPQMGDVVQKLDPKDRDSLQDYINRVRDSAHKTTNQEYMARAIGLSSNDVEKFLDTDFTTWPLNRADLAKLQAKQTQFAKRTEDDPRVSRARGWLQASMGAQLQALGIYSRNANNADDYDHYSGALQQAIEQFQEDHKRAPTYQEVVDQIGPEIISTQTTNKGWLWNSQEPAFREFNKPAPQEVPDEFRRQVTQDVMAKGGAQPTDDQIYRAYTRKQFNKLYGGKDGGPTAPESK